MVRTFIVILLVITVWYTATTYEFVSPLFLPSPIEVASTLADLVADGIILLDVIASLQRVILGFLLGTSIGVFLGLIIGYFRIDVFDAPVDFLRSIPVTALLPLFLLIFGLGDKSKIYIAAWSTSLIMTVSAVYGVKNCRKLRLLAGQVMRATRWQTFSRIVVPEALPHILGGMRIAVSICLIVVIVTEMFLGSERGLGGQIYLANITYRISELYAYIIVTGLLGYSINRLFVYLERRFVFWSGK